MPKTTMTFNQLNEHMHSLISKVKENKELEKLDKLLKELSLKYNNKFIDANNAEPLFRFLEGIDTDLLELKNGTYDLANEHPTTQIYLTLANLLREATEDNHLKPIPDTLDPQQIVRIYRHQRSLSFERIKAELSPHIKLIKTAEDYGNMMTNCPQDEQVEILKLTAETLLKVINTQEDLTHIESSLTKCASKELFTLLGPEKLTEIYRSNNEPIPTDTQISYVSKPALKPSSKSGNASPKALQQFFIPAAKPDVKRSSADAHSAQSLPASDENKTFP